MNREAIIQTSTRIGKLREEIGALKMALKREESALDRLLLGEPAETEPIAFGDDPDMSLNQRIIQVLGSAPLGATLDAEEIASVLGSGINITSVRSALPRLADAKKINRAERGRYEAAKRYASGMNRGTEEAA